MQKKLLRIYIVAFLTGTNLSIVMLSIPLYSIDRFQATSFQLGILGFLLNLAYSLNTFLTGKTGLKNKRIHLIKISLITISFLFLSFLILRTFPLVVFFFALYGLFQAWVWPVLQFSLASFTSEDLSRILGTYNISWAMGNIIGTTLAGWLYQQHYSLPFLTASLFSVISYLLICNLSIRVPEKAIKKESFSLSHPYYLKIARLFNFLNFMILGAMLFLFPKLGKNYNFSPSFIGLILSSLFLGRAVFFFLWRILSFWKYRFSVLFLCPFVSLFSLITIGLTHTPLFLVLSFLLIAFSVTLTFSSSLLASIDQKTGKTITSEINESIIGAGLFLGPLVGGVISRYIPLPYTFLSLIPFLIAGEIAGGFILLARYRKMRKCGESA